MKHSYPCYLEEYMRLDHVLTEGEAENILKKAGFIISENPKGPRLISLAHPKLAGDRAFTVEQFCNFAEGLAVMQTLLEEQRAPTS
jgi:hypothetical protein